MKLHALGNEFYWNQENYIMRNAEMVRCHGNQVTFCFFLTIEGSATESLWSCDLFSPLSFLACSLLKSCLFMCTRPILLPNESWETFFTFLGCRYITVNSTVNPLSKHHLYCFRLLTGLFYQVVWCQVRPSHDQVEWGAHLFKLNSRELATRLLQWYSTYEHM